MSKYLHVMANEKFNTPYIKFIEENFIFNEHEFIFYGGINKNETAILERANIIDITDKCRTVKIKTQIFKKINMVVASINYLRIMNKKIKNSERIYIHGIFSLEILIWLYFNKKNLKKVNWIIWGGDLYWCKFANFKLLNNKIRFFLEKQVVRKLNGVITHNKKDYKLSEKWFGFKGKWYDCFFYPSHLYKDNKVETVKKEELYIQIGNSADPTNNHEYILKKLVKYKNEKIKIFAILSYGDMEYAEKTIKKGKELFGSKFFPIVDFMKFDEYMEFLTKIDIAIFAHDRQQGVGNIISLLSMGKTIYMKKNISSYVMLDELGVKILDVRNMQKLEKLNEEILEKNKKIVKERFSKERLIEDWKNIFKDIK